MDQTVACGQNDLAVNALIRYTERRYTNGLN